MAGEKEKGRELPLATVLDGSSGNGDKRSSARPISYPQLTRTNYVIWAMKMQVALQSQRLWDEVQTATDDFQMDCDALYAIYQAVPDSVMTSLAGKDRAKEAWDAIKTANMGHERVRAANLQTMSKIFEGLKMHDGEAVDDFAGRVNQLVSSMRALGENLTDEAVVRKMFQAAPPRLIQLVISLEQCVDMKTMTIDDVVGRFKERDERMRVGFGDLKEGEQLMLSRSLLEYATATKKKGGEGSSSGTKGTTDRGTSHGRCQLTAAVVGSVNSVSSES